MNKEQKQEVIDVLKDKFSQYSNFYITDTESLSVSQVTTLRRTCFDKKVEMKVAKNTLIKKALESLDNEKYSGVYDALHQVTALMFSESPKDPAVIISSFRKSNNNDRPQLKAAFINGEIFVGDNELVRLTKIKTKDELIGEVIGLLLSPIQKVIGALQNKPETAEAKGDAAASPEAKEANPNAEEKKEDKPAEAPKEAAAAKSETDASAEAPAKEDAPKAEVKKEEKPEEAAKQEARESKAPEQPKDDDENTSEKK